MELVFHSDGFGFFLHEIVLCEYWVCVTMGSFWYMHAGLVCVTCDQHLNASIINMFDIYAYPVTVELEYYDKILLLLLFFMAGLLSASYVWVRQWLLQWRVGALLLDSSDELSNCVLCTRVVVWDVAYRRNCSVGSRVQWSEMSRVCVIEYFACIYTYLHTYW